MAYEIAEANALRELLKRLSPAPRPVELTAAPLRLEPEARVHELPSEPETLAEVLSILGAIRPDGPGAG